MEPRRRILRRRLDDDDDLYASKTLFFSFFTSETRTESLCVQQTFMIRLIALRKCIFLSSIKCSRPLSLNRPFISIPKSSYFERKSNCCAWLSPQNYNCFNPVFCRRLELLVLSGKTFALLATCSLLKNLLKTSSRNVSESKRN